MESIRPQSAPAPKKPGLLKGGMILCWIYAVVLVLILAMLPLMGEMAKMERGVIPTLPDGRHPDAYFVSMTSASQLFIIPLLVLSIIVAYGLAKNRYWSRAMMMTLLVLGVVLIPPEMASPTMYGLSIAIAIFGWWYLYRKTNVVEYYRKIRARAGIGTERDSSL